MKTMTKLIAMAVVLVAALALMGATEAFARGPNPAGVGGPCQESALLDIDEADMHAAIADALGMTVAEFEAARAEGLTLYQIAREQGVDLELVREAMRAVREAAIDEALAAGDITAEQAEWLRSRPGPGGFGYGYGYGSGNGPRNGQGFGAQGNGHGYGHGHQNGGKGMGPGQGWGSNS